jgi:aldehyde dehydrogenase (NAD+)
LYIHGSKQADTVYLLATSSHDDAIDTLGNISNQDPLLASYVFATPPAAKYLTQFVRSRVSFVNHIPANLLGKSLHAFLRLINSITDID